MPEYNYQTHELWSPESDTRHRICKGCRRRIREEAPGMWTEVRQVDPLPRACSAADMNAHAPFDTPPDTNDRSALEEWLDT